MIDLAPEQLALVRKILSRHLPGRDVVVFGSRAEKGQAKPFSDLDLCIMGKEPLPFDVLADLREAFTQSPLPFKVDLVDWSDISDAFREIIKTRSVDLGHD